MKFNHRSTRVKTGGRALLSEGTAGAEAQRGLVCEGQKEGGKYQRRTELILVT